MASLKLTLSTSYGACNICLLYTEQVLSSIPLQNKLMNIDTQNLTQQYVQLYHEIKVQGYKYGAAKSQHCTRLP